MPLYATTYRYVDDSAALDAIRPTHRAYLGDLTERGSLVMSGPYVGGVAGALLVFEADDEDAARALTAADPFVQAGLVPEITVREWNVVLGRLVSSI
jgi:uncharacterized protein YciI